MARLGVVLEEAEECLFWLEILEEMHVLDKAVLRPLLDEANELTAIFVASINTAKQRGRH